jgi:hypothetical protein
MSGGNAPLAILYVVAPKEPVAATLPAYADPTAPCGSDGENAMAGPVTVIVWADEVAVKELGTPESDIVNLMPLYTPTHEAVGV